MHDYRELVVWQLADQLRREVYRLVASSAAERDLRFADQIRSSAASVSANIAEGFRRFGATEFARYLEMSYSSNGETENWLDDGVARGHWAAADIEPARVLVKRLNVGLTRLMRYLRSPEAKHNSKRASSIGSAGSVGSVGSRGSVRGSKRVP